MGGWVIASHKEQQQSWLEQVANGRWWAAPIMPRCWHRYSRDTHCLSLKHPVVMPSGLNVDSQSCLLSFHGRRGEGEIPNWEATALIHEGLEDVSSQLWWANSSRCIRSILSSACLRFTSPPVFIFCSSFCPEQCTCHRGYAALCLMFLFGSSCQQISWNTYFCSNLGFHMPTWR